MSVWCQRPKVARPAAFGLFVLMLGLVPAKIGHQDLGALLARQPEVSQRWRAHVMASPFGSVQVAGFNFPRPVGTLIPEFEYRLASLTSGVDHAPPRELGAFPLPVPRPGVFPQVNRRLKGDLLVPRRSPERQPAAAPQDLKPGRVKSVSFPRPGVRPDVADVTPAARDAPTPAGDPLPSDARPTPADPVPEDEATLPSWSAPEIDLQAAIAAEPVEMTTPGDDVALLNPDVDLIDHADPTVRTARIYFGSRPIGEAVGPIEPWPAGEEPVLVMPPPADRDVKHTALAPAQSDEQAPARARSALAMPAETVAPKGQVTGPDQRPKTPAERLGLNVRERARAEKCLAEAVYFESRGEPVRGQVAVAQVVMNRVFSGFYPGNVCGVVYQNAHRHLACQFTFACDNVKDVVREPELWVQARQIARDTMDGKLWLPEIGKSTHYHASWVNPWWVRTMRKNARIGVHTFYRPRRWGDGADAPAWGPGVTAPLRPTAEAKPAAAKM